MIGDIFEGITETVTNFVGTMSSGLNQVSTMFYDAQQGQLTLVGTLSTIVVGVSLVYFLIRWIVGLIRLRG